MRRIIAALALALLACFTAHAAGPSNRQAGRFTMTTPRSLVDLRKLEERVQWAIRRVQPAVVGMGGGSAVVVSREGTVLTVAHVGQRSGRDVVFIFPNGKRARGKTLGNYRGVDAGVAKITDKGPFPFAPMGKSSELKVGQWVITMGFPLSFAKGMKPPVRVGRILSLSTTAIVTDCPMIGGDSGGPLFNLDGEVIGQNSRTAGGANRNVHVPVDVFHSNWKKLLAGEDWGAARTPRRPGSIEEECQAPRPDERPRRGGLGGFFRMGGPNERMAEGVRSAFREATAPHRESVVRVLCDGKPVALGTVVDADGLIVTKASQLKGKTTCKLADGRTFEATKLAEDRQGDLAVLRVKAKGLKPAAWREGVPEQGNLVAAVGEKGDAISLGTVTSEPRTFRLSDRPRGTPGRGGAGPARPYLGIGIEDGKGGVKVNRVAPGSAAAKARLKDGDLIKKVGDAAVKNMAQLRAAMARLKAGDKVVLVVERNGKDEKVTATLGNAVAAGLPYDRWGGGPFSERRFGFGKVLPTDAVVKPEDCGGPVVDTSGKVVGVTVSRALRISTFILPAEEVARIVAQAKKAEKK